MIVTKLTGGLGNQLFQYAMARSIANRLKADICFDTRIYETDTKRQYDLGHFNIKGKVIAARKLKAFFRQDLITRIVNKIFRIAMNKWAFPTPLSYHQPYFEYDQNVNNLQDNLYLEGDWQTEKYFFDIRKELLEELTVTSEIEGENKSCLKEIIKNNSVFIHIRRGDYISDKTANVKHGTCDIDYYQRCAEFISTKVDNPHFYLFSDDPNWVKDNLKLKYPTTYVDWNDIVHNYEDLRLMSNCKHAIIANSSMSWWGAWLIKNPEKIVCGPKQWFKTNELNSQDVIPSSWFKF